MKILVVTVDNNLTFSDHLQDTVNRCSRSFYALRTIWDNMRQYSLPCASLKLVFSCTVLAKLLYGLPSFWGFLNSSDKQRLQAFLKRSAKFGYRSPDDPDIIDLAARCDQTLFKSIVENIANPLRHLLPPVHVTTYNLNPDLTVLTYLGKMTETSSKE